jgi:hypothetical protein
MKTKIAETKDGVAVYWGKKDTDDLTSRNLDFWICTNPLEFNTYVRVRKIANEGILFNLSEKSVDRRKKYENAVKLAISKLTLAEMSKLMEKD